jgi:hypothetical protein
MPLEDDWAYARTVEHLVDTGRYQLHPWLSANMPFQAVWGAMFVLLLGPGFGSLRLSTIILSAAGLWAFYVFLRAGGWSQTRSCGGVLVLWSSPLYLRFSFNFMTDVPFASLMMLSVWLYTAAWTRRSHGWMTLAAAAGTAAILTRQFGVALIPAVLLIAWLQRSAPRTPSLVAVAAIPLILAAVYQVATGLSAPTWAQQINRRAQLAMLRDWRLQLEQLLWRPGVLLEYLCLFTLPLAVGISLQWTRRGFPKRLRSREFARICVVVALVLGLSLAIGWAAHLGIILPILPWNLADLLGHIGMWGRGALTAAMLIWAVPLAAMLVTALRRDFSAALAATGLRGITSGPAADSDAARIAGVMMHATMICLLPTTLVYRDFGDEYLLVYLPWVIWALGGFLASRFAAVAMAGVALLQLAAAIVWVDILLSTEQVQWQAAQNAVEHFHVSPDRVSAGWTWATYYGFEDYAARFPFAGQTDFSTLFERWLPAYHDRAEYHVRIGHLAGPLLPDDVTVARRHSLLGHVLEARAVRALPP